MEEKIIEAIVRAMRISHETFVDMDMSTMRRAYEDQFRSDVGQLAANLLILLPTFDDDQFVNDCYE